MSNSITEFIDLLSLQVNRAVYVWGGNGENILQMSDPAAWIERRETSAENVEKDLALYEKRKAAGIDPIRAFDCSGLVYWALKQLGAIEHDLSSRGLYSESEKITEKDLQPGDLVFHSNETRIVHVGVFVGEGQYIECRGRDVGVVKNKRKDGYWTHFGRWKKLIDKEPKPEPTPQPKPEPQPRAVIRVHGSVKVREGNGTFSKKIVTVKDCDLPYMGQAIEAPYWYMTQVFDKSGNLRDGYISSKPKYTEVVTVYV